jgi:putative transposase
MYSFYKKRKHRNSLRYPGRDYSLPGKYFVTICTSDRIRWFGKIINGEIQLSDIGNIAYRFWHDMPQHFPYVTIDEFVIMPNHIHGIIIINKSAKIPVVGLLHATNLPRPDKITVINASMSSISPKIGSLSVVIRSYKSAVTKNAHLIDGRFSWQSRFYDNIICTSGQLTRIRKYIKNNPRNWK